MKGRPLEERAGADQSGAEATPPLKPRPLRVGRQAVAELQAAESPQTGRRVKGRRIRGLRRLLLPVTRYHVYYVYRPELAKVVMLSIWSAHRGRGPRLRAP